MLKKFVFWDLNLNVLSFSLLGVYFYTKLNYDWYYSMKVKLINLN